MTILLIVCIGCMYWIYDSRQVKANHLQAEVNILWNYKLNEPGLKERINTLEKKNTDLTEQLKSVTISYKADEMMVDTLTSDYLLAISYITVAESILTNQGIEFTYMGRR